VHIDIVRSIISGIVLFAVISASCGSDCLAHPCPLPFAIHLTVTSNTGVTVPGLVVGVATLGTSVPCDFAGSSDCFVVGDPGTYQVDVSAPGFQSVQKTVQVGGSGPTSCNCSSPNTQNVTVTLAVASGAPHAGALGTPGRP
jgi:hypothetical protein